uniref:HAT C-terminal dimerisation domain-containing protein n=1 Tax=Lactuca sativa TaxID=4236 RepID=A0A9R1WDX8_LACSA|nr:hypothetical protein LSAT_V11C200078560 [Lactuca sativa]
MSFIHVTSPHTADALSQAMMECFLECNVDNKLSTLTLDNCSTNDAIVGNLLDGFSVIANAIENVRNSVSFWTSSPNRIQDCRLFAWQVGVNCQKELLLDYKNKVEFHLYDVDIDSFNHLRKKDKHYVCLPGEDEWNMASDVCEKLKLFYQLTEKNSGAKYLTSNIFFPLICDMKLLLLSWKDLIHNVMSVAIVLDPMYKLKLTNYLFPKLYGEDQEVGLCKYCIKRNMMINEELLGNENVQPTSLRERLDFENMLSKDDGFEKTDLGDYIAEKSLLNEEGFDILTWWKDVLAIPISTVASETTFSMSGNKVTKQCNRLKPEIVGTLMCSQSWLWKELQCKTQGEP